MSEEKHYPNYPPDTLGDGAMKKIEHLPGMQSRAPEIRWGGDFESWDDTRKLKFAMRLASSMNHAADVMQQERNKLLVLCKQQAAQIERHQDAYRAQGQLMNTELGQANVEKQELYKQIVQLQGALKEKQKRIKVLEAEREAARGPKH